MHDDVFLRHDNVFVVIGEYEPGWGGYPAGSGHEDIDVKLYRALDHAEAAAYDMSHGFGAKRVRVYRVYADDADGDEPERPFPEWLFGQQLHERIERLDYDEVPTAA